MAAFNFPNSPSTNDLHTENNVTWKWNGTVWKRINNSYLTASTLDISGIGTFGGKVGIADSIVHTGNENTSIRFPSTSELTVETGGAERFRIDSIGRVGVGTAHPKTSFEVRDAKANVVIAKDGLTIKQNNDISSTYDILQIGAGGALASYSTATVTADTQFVHNAYRHSGHNWKYRYADSAARIRMNSPQGAIIFDNAAAGSADGDITFSERVRITSDGKVGIGNRTTSPNSNLHVHTASGDCTARVEAGSHSRLRLTAHNGASIVEFGDASSDAIGKLQYTHSNDQFDIRVNGSDRITVSSAGNVWFKNGSYVSFNDNGYIRTDSSGYLRLQMGSNGTMFTNSSNSELARIDPTGNFGFNTSNTSGYSGHTNLFIGGMGNIYAESSASSSASISISNNAYIPSSGGWKYRTGGKASNIYQYDGGIGFRTAGTGSAGGTITWNTRCMINDDFGVKAENTCKAWLCYRGENGQEGILDDYNVASVSDEATGTFAVTFSRNLTQHSGGKYSLTFGSHNWSPCMLIAGVAYTSSHGSNNPWWGMEDNFVRIHTMRSDSNTLVDAEVFFMTVHGDTGDV